MSIEKIQSLDFRLLEADILVQINIDSINASTVDDIKSYFIGDDFEKYLPFFFFKTIWSNCIIRNLEKDKFKTKISNDLNIISKKIKFNKNLYIKYAEYLFEQKISLGTNSGDIFKNILLETNNLIIESDVDLIKFKCKKDLLSQLLINYSTENMQLIKTLSDELKILKTSQDYPEEYKKYIEISY